MCQYPASVLADLLVKCWSARLRELARVLVRWRELEHSSVHVREPAAHEPEPGHLSGLEPASAHTVVVVDMASSCRLQSLGMSRLRLLGSGRATAFRPSWKNSIPNG